MTTQVGQPAGDNRGGLPPIADDHTPPAEPAAASAAEPPRDVGTWCRHFDPYTPTVEDVYDGYRELRAHCPVTHSDRYGGFWVLSRYRDVFAAIRDHASFASGRGVHLPRREGHLQVIPLDCDPPAHTAYRALITGLLSQESISKIEPFIRTLVADLLEPVVARGGGDLVAEVAMPLPLQVVCRLLGLSSEAARTVRALTERMWREYEQLGDEARWPLAEFLLGEVRERQTTPRDDFISQLVRATVDGRALTERELAAIVLSLANAGHQTTMNASGNAMLHLARYPEDEARLRAEPTLIPSFVEENLRYYPPAQMFARTLTRAVTIDGTTLEKGETVLLLYGSANRDPEQFPDPDRFIPERPANRHLSFGWGIHFCAGAALARAELRILLEELITNRPPFRLAGTPTHSRMEGGHHLGPTFLPVVFTP